MKRIVVICPVRNGTPQQVFDYVANLEGRGVQVHFPPRDNPREDKTGYFICLAMLNAIRQADEIHAFYSTESQGCHFDLGMAFALGKKVVILNPEVDASSNKSYIKVFLDENHQSIS